MVNNSNNLVKGSSMRKKLQNSKVYAESQDKQEEDAAVFAATQKRKRFAKPEEVIHSHHSMQVSQLFIAAFAARPNFKAGNYGESEP